MTPNKTKEQPIPAAYMDWISSEFESQKGTIIKDLETNINKQK